MCFIGLILMGFVKNLGARYFGVFLAVSCLCSPIKGSLYKAFTKVSP